MTGDFLKEGHFERHVRRMRRVYGRRRLALTSALAKHLGEKNVALIEKVYSLVETMIALGPEVGAGGREPPISVIGTTWLER